MLKVAASDYDGTLFRDDIITAEDAEAVRQLRAINSASFPAVTTACFGRSSSTTALNMTIWPAIMAALSATDRTGSSGKPVSNRPF